MAENKPKPKAGPNDGVGDKKKKRVKKSVETYNIVFNELCKTGNKVLSKPKMALQLGKDEHKLFIHALKIKPVPMTRRGTSWLNIDVWRGVTAEYNARAQERGFRTHRWTNLGEYGKRLQYCNCKRGHDHCNCLIPEFPDIDGAGEPSSKVSLGSTSTASGSGIVNDATAMYRTLITSELLRLKTLHNLTMKNFQDAMYAWQEELKEGLMMVEGFTQGDDTMKLSLTRD